jgi:hypothetical protein
MTNILKTINSKKIFRLFIALFVITLFFAIKTTAAKAASNIDAVLTSSGTKYVGHTFDVDVRVNTDSKQVDTISLRNLNFDATKLQLTNTQIYTLFASQTPLANNNRTHICETDF